MRSWHLKHSRSFPRRIFSLAFILSVKLKLVVRVWQPVCSSGSFSASLLLLLPSASAILFTPTGSVASSQFRNARVENSAENQGWVNLRLSEHYSKQLWWWAEDQLPRHGERGSQLRTSKYWLIIIEGLGGRTISYWPVSVYVRYFYLEHSLTNIHFRICFDLNGKFYVVGNVIQALLVLNTFRLQLTAWVSLLDLHVPKLTIFSKPNIQKKSICLQRLYSPMLGHAIGSAWALSAWRPGTSGELARLGLWSWQ